MLSDEEKKAIEIVTEDIEVYKQKGVLKENSILVKSLRTVLNLIKKQSKEIEELKFKKIRDEKICIQIGEFIEEKKWKDKIKEIIEELKKERSKLNFESDCMLIDDIDNKIEVLESFFNNKKWRKNNV